MIGNSLYIGDQIEWTALDAEKDAAEISKWTLNPSFSSELFSAPARPHAVFEVKKKLEEMIKDADEKRDAYIFAIRKKGTKELIALLRFGWLHLSHQSARLFLSFPSPETISLYGEELMKMTLRYAYMEISLHRLWCEIAGCAVAEMSLYEGAGFIRETQRREAAFCDGKYYDLMVYSLLKPEWKKIQSQEVTA